MQVESDDYYITKYDILSSSKQLSVKECSNIQNSYALNFSKSNNFENEKKDIATFNTLLSALITLFFNAKYALLK